MGLDISYNSKLKNAGPSTNNDSDYNHELKICNELCFQYQLGSLMREHLYDTTLNSQSGSFHVGSYGGYNQWRNELAIMAGHDGADNVWQDNSFDSFKTFNLRKDKLDNMNGNSVEKVKPFYELINFSDAEGVIGPEVSKKLYQDFIDFDEQAKKYAALNSKIPYCWFYDKYCQWKEAFRVASDGGAVSFH